METPGYTTLARQSGLMREMQVIANNIANASTIGFRREGVVFSEYIARLENESSLSMAHGNARHIDLGQAGLSQTGGTYDLGLQGEGFFLIATPEGERLTRAGAFSPSGEGELVTPDGYPLLDAGGAPVPVPVGARTVSIASDGTMSADGQPVAQIGVWQPVDPLSLRHQNGTLFSADAIEPSEGATMRQGFLEDSNVQPVSEIARMITVQRAYELGQKFLDTEDQRQRTVIQTLGR
ncbi:MAG: flagellar hook-basal body complex protein [Pseudotabrizicola sp.]|uniref:flagellar hook-basal body complex protein n=1 Tax=Pseudotabrizicola sp. TaxID=2939647 RepID=UPI0027288864|nr:flagellar hook-basal body complex protein [Pseudotabrizicola sp.]MDO8885261.1 flagellar hook-basal body complex protein [Pseudotabrizicola sp.]MDP2081148.1 flagellar hook-basal body complex protein [Pseudotabrizicola sp.]MDZ7575707.1 flagellar hook-basal body complex protein [Pseudotabrizicola sp.]